MTHTPMAPLPASSRKSDNLRGEVIVPGDKSISHRSLIIASQLLGETVINNMLVSEDVERTATALQQTGVTISHDKNSNQWRVQGVGIGGLKAPSDVVNMGNSGTSTRLLAGLFSSYPFTVMMTGDDSLRKRPMKRIIDPLSALGATFMSNEAQTLPLAMTGAMHPLPTTYRMSVASAQVKSALMLAALNIAGTSTVIESVPTRDHTERMFRAVGFPVTIEQREDGAYISVTGQPAQQHGNHQFDVPADPSSAAFLAVAALITSGSALTLRNVGMNATRAGIYETLREMGGDVTLTNEREVQGEPVADIVVKSSTLRGIDVPASRAPSMIDEYPVLAVAAAYATGTTRLEGLEELRVKESDRFAAVMDGLLANGVNVEAEGDTMIIHGGQGVAGGGIVKTHLDHRIAMSFLVLGLGSDTPVYVDDTNAIHTSFPSFMALMRDVGAAIDSAPGALASPMRRKSDKPLVIAIDGPAASGKGTLARRLADYFAMAHLDTGGLYRAAALKLLSAGGNPEKEADALRAAQSIMVHDLSNPRLRDEEVGNIASRISAIASVRAALLDFQREFARSQRGAILDGRDIGTVVCPDAAVKIFMTASLEARAQRRHKQLQRQGIEVVFDSVLQDLKARDARDTQRQNAPLKPAEDAYQIDTTSMSIDEVFGELVQNIQRDIAQRRTRPAAAKASA